MAARKTRKIINLLPQEEFAVSTPGRILSWLLSSFRIIVIVTEMVVMIAFLSRFWLDAKSADLNDSIKQRQSIIAASADFEQEFKKTQKEILIFSELTMEDHLTTDYLDNVSSFLPPEVALISFSLIGNEIRLEGVSPSERSIAQFVANLESTDVFKEVSITQVSTDKEYQFLLNYSLKLKLAEKGGE